MAETHRRFTWRGWLPVIMQTEASECGLACLAMIASYYGHRLDLNTLRRQHPVSLTGVTLRGLIQIANQLHLSGRPLRVEIEHLGQLKLPAILHWDMKHYVVLKSVGHLGIVVHDPAHGERSFSFADSAKHVTGVALELTPTEGFTPKDERARLPFSAFLTNMQGLTHGFVQIFVLSLLLEAFVVASPFYMQLTLDEVIARGDIDLLVVLALGFGLLTAARVATNTIRSLVLVFVQNFLHFQMSGRLFHHLIRLPLSYFEKRHVGDVLSRFSSIEPIRNLMAEGMITALIDGVMVVATLTMMFIYSPLLSVVVLVAVVLYACFRIILYRSFRQRSSDLVESRAVEASMFIETLRAIQSLKLFNRESDRESQWLNRFSDVQSASVRLSRARITFSAINEILFGLENIISVYLAANLALQNVLTVGMIFAFMSYKQNFSGKTILLIEKALDFRLLDLHLERIADIALTPLESGHDWQTSYMRTIRGAIELRNVFFRYAETEPYVLEAINLKIEAGQFVTITGPSGGGKTSLIKIMLGLLEPTSGEVLIDGVRLLTLGPKAYREQIGVVMQEDQLLSGSLADNICFFDPVFDQERMIACAKLACIHDEIMAMSMTYSSLVGDMGSSLSGGQKQRVLLARALYRQPQILFMDEGTAHLDIENERRINENLRRLRITRVNVAHRQEIASGADCVFWVAKTVHIVSQEAAPEAIVDGRRDTVTEPVRAFPS